MNPRTKDVLCSDRGIGYTDVWIRENSSTYVYLNLFISLYVNYTSVFFLREARTH